MPIYEFKCNTCGQIFEHLVFASDHDQELECPFCGKSDACRVMSSFSCGASSAGGLSPAGCGPSTGGFS